MGRREGDEEGWGGGRGMRKDGEEGGGGMGRGEERWDGEEGGGGGKGRGGEEEEDLNPNIIPTHLCLQGSSPL